MVDESSENLEFVVEYILAGIAHMDSFENVHGSPVRFLQSLLPSPRICVSLDPSKGKIIPDAAHLSIYSCPALAKN